MAAQPLDAALAEVRTLLLDRARLRRAVAAGRRKPQTPSVVRAELRPIELKSGPHLQVITRGNRPYTRNLAWDGEAAAIVDALLAEPFGNWHVETAEQTLQLRVTKKGGAQVHRAAAVWDPTATSHDRDPEHLLDPGDPLYQAIGGTAAKRRQVDAFLRAVRSTVDVQSGEPLLLVDLGCGNAYLTFAAYRYLAARGADVRMVGVDIRADQRDRNTALAQRLGWSDRVRFVAGAIEHVELSGVDVVLALHACDTATDDALARAVRWRVPYILAAPCCHHDVAAQLRAAGPAPAPYGILTRYPILRERFADTLTDGLRAALLRRYGYRVDVVEFVDSVHTARNVLLRARFTGAEPAAGQLAEYAALTRAWGIAPALERLLAEGTQAQAVRDHEDA